jgi:hypothetical protein
MESCPFFREAISYVRREVNTGHMGAQPALPNTTPWCAHKHSPRRKPQPGDLLGGQRLVCAGAADACQVPEALRGDFR